MNDLHGMIQSNPYPQFNNCAFQDPSADLLIVERAAKENHRDPLGHCCLVFSEGFAAGGTPSLVLWHSQNRLLCRIHCVVSSMFSG